MIDHVEPGTRLPTQGGYDWGGTALFLCGVGNLVLGVEGSFEKWARGEREEERGRTASINCFALFWIREKVKERKGCVCGAGRLSGRARPPPCLPLV